MILVASKTLGKKQWPFLSLAPSPTRFSSLESPPVDQSSTSSSALYPASKALVFVNASPEFLAAGREHLSSDLSPHGCLSSRPY